MNEAPGPSKNKAKWKHTTQESEIPVTREASWRRTSRHRHKQLCGTALGTFWRGGFC